MANPLLITGSSTNRWLDIKTGNLDGEWVIEQISGTETLGRSFEYEAVVLHARGDLSLDSLLYMPVTVLMETDDSGTLPRRAINGIVFQAHGLGAVHNFDNLYRYRLVLRPWVWGLSYYKDCRIFQNMDVKAILKEVFDEYSEEHYDFRVTGQYPKREYCVQYRESDLDFVSRLMEEEGMYYFIEHTDSEHKVVICDAPSNHKSIGSIRMRYDDDRAKHSGPRIHRWTQTSEWRPNTVEFRDYNFETPSNDLHAASKDTQGIEDAGGSVWEYDYPGLYAEVSDGGGGEKPEGTRLARHRLESLGAAGYHVSEGSSDSRQIQCGSLFTLLDHQRKNLNTVEFLVVSARIEASNNLPELNVETYFDCRFRTTLGHLQYRSSQITPRPIVQGPQTAVVVGPDGEEIHVDPYGRVKLQFHWDRVGKHNDSSSCWVRVSQIWAGKNYGWLTIPRVGQEVVVDFLEGNPDRPLITGRVYNAEQMPPGKLPDTKTLSGILTRSTPEGTPDNANSFYFDDKKGDELVVLWAEKDNHIRVENDEHHWVGNDRTKNVDNDETTTIGNNRTEDVGNDETITIGNNRTESVGNNEKITIGANRTESVGADENITIGANRTEKVAVNEGVTIGANRDLKVGASETITVGASRTDTIGASLTQNIGASLTQNIGAAATITCGGPMTITAASYTVIAPGGSKIIDDNILATGAKYFFNYGVKIGVQVSKVDTTMSISTSMQATKIDLGGNKVDKSDMKASKSSASFKDDGVLLEKENVAMFSRTASIFL